MKRKNFVWTFYIFLVFSLVILLNINLSNVYNLPNNFYVSYDEVEQINDSGRFGKLVKLNLQHQEITTGDLREDKNVVIFKLFGFIPIKKIVVQLLPEEEVYTGGMPIGLTINTSGAMVVSDGEVDIKNLSLKKNNILKNGDIIIAIEGQKINSTIDIEKILNNSAKDKIEITYLRDEKEITQSLPLIKDENDNYKLGVWVRDDISGVGTLSFVKKDNTYAALGHAVTNGVYENVLPATDGNIYTCSLVGIKKGEKNNPGELKCVFVNKDSIGSIIKNTKYGIYGNLEESNKLIDKNLTVQMGGRLSVKPGKAKIVSNISGIREEYDIEIIKAKCQNKDDDKSIVFRVKDKRLLNLTGGIVQGMSGSPILQNGKLVGVVTHVFLADATKGYGVYCDWMLKQMDF